MIYIHETPDLECYFKVIEPEKTYIYGNHKYVRGTILYIINSNHYKSGDQIQFGLKWSKLVTEDDLMKLNKILTFQ